MAGEIVQGPELPEETDGDGSIAGVGSGLPEVRWEVLHARSEEAVIVRRTKPDFIVSELGYRKKKDLQRVSSLKVQGQASESVYKPGSVRQ